MPKLIVKTLVVLRQLAVRCCMKFGVSLSIIGICCLMVNGLGIVENASQASQTSVITNVRYLEHEISGSVLKLLILKNEDVKTPLQYSLPKLNIELNTETKRGFLVGDNGQTYFLINNPDFTKVYAISTGFPTGLDLAHEVKPIPFAVDPNFKVFQLGKSLQIELNQELRKTLVALPKPYVPLIVIKKSK